MDLYFVALIGYIIGSFQTAFFIGKLTKNIDIREHGTTNAGASNVTIVMGWKYGIITAIIDILKGVLAVLVVRYLYPDLAFLPFLAGTMAVLGHIFPVYLKFKGGKGTATIVGFVMAYDYRMGLILMFAIILLTIITDYISLASVIMYTTLPIISFFFGYQIDVISLGILLAVISYIKHYENMVRISKGEEKGLRGVIKK